LELAAKNQNMKGKIYFASDFHLGIPDHDNSLRREKLFIKWLDEVRRDAFEIYLMGDIFDFWFEYTTVVPKGFVRLLGKLAEITDKGIPIHLFRGNHDVWAFDYLEKEIHIQLHRNPEIKEFSGQKFYLAHGDGLGPDDGGYKFLKKIFAFRPNQFLFSWLHPDIGTRLGLFFSKRSRYAHFAREGKKEKKNHLENEMLYHYATSILKKHPDIDCFIFGHRHLPTDIKINDQARFILLGDWLVNFSYAVYDGTNLELKFYPSSF
jgi:UDP-2,3-diacylglucosamine hydrolase